jgi:sugar O-acyltransferase (sialic acid O-acetyltransferase NeuD family)
MVKKSDIILIGGFHEMVELCEICNRKIIGIIDPQLVGHYLEYEIFGDDKCAPSIYEKWGGVPLIVSPDLPEKRKELTEYYSRIGFRFTTLIHPQAFVSKSAAIGKGVIIQTGVHVSASVKLADFVRVNVFANLMHDVVVEQYATIAPNAVLLGSVKVGEMCYVGANTTILPGVKIGARSMVGAGSVVTRDVDDRTTFIGKPERSLKASTDGRV